MSVALIKEKAISMNKWMEVVRPNMEIVGRRKYMANIIRKLRMHSPNTIKDKGLRKGKTLKETDD